MTQLESTLEAVLFAAGDAVPLDRLCAALATPREDILAAAGALETLYDLENRGLMLRRIGDRLQLCSRPMYAEAARRVTESRRAAPLSPAALEVLTIVAYRQPVTRAFIDQLRGVDSGGTLAGLAEKQLIEEAGRLEVPADPSSTARPSGFCRRSRSRVWMTCRPCPRSRKTSSSSSIPTRRRPTLHRCCGRKRSRSCCECLSYCCACSGA